MSMDRSNGVEITGTVRGLDGQAFPALKQCRAFITQATGKEVIVVTDVINLQSLLETAFTTRSEVVLVYEPNANAQNELKQIRFNVPGTSAGDVSSEAQCDFSLSALGLSIDELNLIDYAK